MNAEGSGEVSVGRLQRVRAAARRIIGYHPYESDEIIVISSDAPTSRDLSDVVTGEDWDDIDQAAIEADNANKNAQQRTNKQLSDDVSR